MSDASLERWRGSVDSTLDDHERRLEAINGHIADSAQAVQNFAVAQAESRTRIAIFAGLTAGAGSIAGSALFGVVVYFVTAG